MWTYLRHETICIFHVILTSALLVCFVVPAYSNLVSDKVTIECGEDPDTSVVNVTYFGEAESTYPIKNQRIVDTCEGDYRMDGTYVLIGVNRRNCTFSQVGKTKAWTIKVKVQRKHRILTALDKEFSLTCVYDDFKVADSP